MYSKRSPKGVEQLEIGRHAKSIQTTTLPWPEYLEESWKLEETYCYLSSSERLLARNTTTTTITNNNNNNNNDDDNKDQSYQSENR